MQLTRETMNFSINAFDRIESGATFIGTEIVPAVLHSMLDEVEEKGYAHIVSWQPHGRCFVVHNRKEFVAIIMPAYFRMSKFASFQRQLNLYDFKRITAGPDKGGYYHENFVRGRKGLCKYIQRQQVKGTLTRKPAPESEPDFYRLSMMRYADADKMPIGRPDDIMNTTSLSDLMMNARVCQSNTNRVSSFPSASMFPSNLTSKQGFSNSFNDPDALGRQSYSKASLDDFQGFSTQSLLAVMGGAPRVQQFCNGSSAPTFQTFPQSEQCNQEAECFSRGMEPAVSMLRPGRYAICEDTKRVMYTSAQDHDEGCIGNSSIISILCPSRQTRCEEPRQSFKMSHAETRFDQVSKAYNGDIENTGFDSFSNSFFPGQTMEAPAAEEIYYGTAENNTFFNDGSNIDWMQQKTFY